MYHSHVSQNTRKKTESTTEINKKQKEYHYKSNTLKKHNKYYGVNIDIKTSKRCFMDVLVFEPKLL